VFIQNLARSVWEVRRSDEDEGDDLRLAVYHRKVNTGRRHRPIALRLHFTHEAVTLHPADLTERVDLMKRLSLRQQVIRQLEKAPGLTAAQLADTIEADEATVLRTLGRLAEESLVRKVNAAKPFQWGLVVR
jgi:CRP-like cAMP-binding protein